MRSSVAYLAVWAVASAMIAPSTATAAGAADCVALDQLLREARTDFPSLKRKKLAPASCSHRGQQFKCEWAFPADAFAAVEAQAARLKRCAAAQPGAEPLAPTRDEARFQINPETLVAIRGPELGSGSWRLRLQITSTADWD